MSAQVEEPRSRDPATAEMCHFNKAFAKISIFSTAGMVLDSV
jgi:hypothetical protein